MEKLTKYWNDRYVNGGNSGAGSYGLEAFTKAQVINKWIKQYGIKTINEIGCGDGNNLLLYDIPISYTGYDISQKAVEICNEKTRRIPNSLKYYFTNEFNDMDFDADLCLVLDVWYHLVDDLDFHKFCRDLFEGRGKWKYIIIYSTDTDSQFLDDGTPLAAHLKFRKVLETVESYPNWELLYWLSGFQTSDEKTYNFPASKKFFIFKRKHLENPMG